MGSVGLRMRLANDRRKNRIITTECQEVILAHATIRPRNRCACEARGSRPTQRAIELGYRSRMTEEFAILGMVQKGWITGLNGQKFGGVGFIVNCPIVYRFL